MPSTRSLPLTLAFLVAHALSAQKVQEASATYSIVLSRTATMADTETQCIEQARLKAVGDAFGYTVSEITLARVLDTRDSFEDNFSVLTRTSVEGEWLGDTEPPVVQWNCVGNDYKVTATVHGKIRAFAEKAKAQVEFHATTPGEGQARNEFRHGQTLHAVFRSSHKGHLSVYFVDHTEGKVYRLFPAAAYGTLDHLPVEGDRTYVLFDRAHASQFPGHPAVSELNVEVPAGKPQVIDELVAVYSPKPYSKPLLSLPNDPQELPTMDFDRFEAWLTDLRKREREAVAKRKQVTIVR
jgi:hypothetical protein